MYDVSWADPSNLVKISRKINGNLQTFENFHEFLANFHLKKLILIKINKLWNYENLIILKERKKPSGKSLLVWAKTLLRFEICEKTLYFMYTNLNGKLIFYTISLILQDFCHFIHHWKSTIWGLWGSS